MSLIIYTDSSEVLKGKLAELRKSINELAEFVRTNEPRLISYNAYFNEDETRMNVVHIHSDSESLAFHMKIAGPAFPAFAKYLRLLTIDIYGDPGIQILEEFRKKAQLLGNGTVAVHRLCTGFARFGIT